MALHLFNALPLSQWVPMDATDWVTLRHWILEFASTSIENQLARLIIEHLNWGTAEQVKYLDIVMSKYRVTIRNFFLFVIS